MANTNCLSGLRCPNCKQEDELHVVASVWVTLIDDGAEPADGNYEFDDTSTAQCPRCGLQGTLAAFRIEDAASR